jgi:hypothetical protein
MADRLLGKMLVRLIVAKYAVEPANRLAKISAKTGCQSQIVRDQANVLFVGLRLSELKRYAKLLLGLAPAALEDSGTAAGVEACSDRFPNRRLQGSRLAQAIRSPRRA